QRARARGFRSYADEQPVLLLLREDSRELLAVAAGCGRRILYSRPRLEALARRAALADLRGRARRRRHDHGGKTHALSFPALSGAFGRRRRPPDFRRPSLSHA